MAASMYTVVKMKSMAVGASCGYNVATPSAPFSSRLHHHSSLATPSLFLRRRQSLPSLRVRAAATQEQTMQSSPKVAKSLESVEVLDLEGKRVLVADLWKDRRAVVGFTRHFGCVLCMKRADLFASRKDELDAANVSLIIVGPGKVDQANAFAKSTNFPGEIYADPEAATHKALEFVSGVGSTISLTTGLRVISAYLEGFKQDWGLSFDKDTVSKGGWQQGGVLVAGPGKENILYLFKDAQAGDEPNMDEIVAICRDA